jgi:hypothetical protein
MSSLPPEKNPRSRIVITLDNKAVNAVATTPRRVGRGRRILLISGLSLLVLVVVCFVAGFLWWQHYQSGAAYSLALLADAVQRGDMEEFDKLVDTDQVIEGFVPQVVDNIVAGYSTAIPGSIRKQVEAQVPKYLPQTKQRLHEEISNKVRELAANTESKPFFLIAIAVPWLGDVKETGDTATAAFIIKNHPVELSLKRGPDNWIVIGVRDEILAALIADEVKKKFSIKDGVNADELRREIEKGIPGGLPKVP